MLGQGGRWLTLVRGSGPRREAAARPSDRARGLWSGELGLLSGLPGRDRGDRSPGPPVRACCLHSR